MTPLSALALPLGRHQGNHRPRKCPRTMYLTGPSLGPARKKMETPQDIIEIEIATVGAASPSEIERPVAVADVAEACGPVVNGTRFRSFTDEAGAGGPAVTGTGGLVVTGTRFEKCTDPAPVRKTLEEEPMEHSAPGGNPNEGSEPLNTDVLEETEDGEAIVVGAVGSAAPWLLTGWTNDVEVEFMIDTGCQVTILATSVFEKMCTGHPQVRSRIRPCMRRLVSADSSPLTVIGKIDLDVVFPD